MSASQRLLKAEIDIWFDIFAYAGVVPLIRTRVTCKNFANLTKERSLWVRMLCAFSKEHRIPSATYDISNMSVSELEAAVCVPIKFRRVLLGKMTNYTISHSSPPNTNSDPASGLPVLHDEYDDEVVHPKHTQLIPGGRFLVSVDRSGGRPSITCWDLHRQLENKLNVPMASWSPEDTGGGYWTIVGSPRIQHDRDDPDAFLIMVTSDYWPESSRTRARHIFILRLSLSSAAMASGHPGFVCMRRHQFTHHLINSTEFQGNFVIFIETEQKITIWEWAQNLWGVMRPSRTGRINHASLVGTDILCVHLGFAANEDDREETTRVLLSRFPRLFPTQKEASREENIMNERELYRVEILGRSSPATQSGLALAVPVWETAPKARGRPESMLFHLITPLERTPSSPFRSACVQLSVSKSRPDSTKDSKMRLPSSSVGLFDIFGMGKEYLRRYSSTTTSSTPAFSSPSSLSEDQITILHAQFTHLSQIRDSSRGFGVSPFGDVVYLSLETGPRVDVTSDTVDEADSDSVVHWLGAETLGITDLSPLATDNLPPDHTKVDVDVTTSADGILSDAQADSLKARTGKIVDLGGARDCHFTYIDWWNGAIVQQVETLYGDFYLFTRKTTVAT